MKKSWFSNKSPFQIFSRNPLVQKIHSVSNSSKFAASTDDILLFLIQLVLLYSIAAYCVKLLLWRWQADIINWVIYCPPTNNGKQVPSGQSETPPLLKGVLFVLSEVPILNRGQYILPCTQHLQKHERLTYRPLMCCLLLENVVCLFRFHCHNISRMKAHRKV